jgi:hypothetical protein
MHQTRVTIDLSDQFDNLFLQPNQLIQIAKLSRLIELVGNALRPQNVEVGCRKNNVFFIDGTRGAGKTTFLDAARKYLVDPVDVPGFEMRTGATIVELCRIDPTLIETGEHIFFTVLASLAEVMESKVRHANDEQTRGAYDNWRKSFKSLAKGANLLSEREVSSFSDDYLNLDQGIANARSGTKLESAFRKLVEEASRLVGADAFLLSFDDVDTDFTQGYKVLELIRRYLQCPQLIVLITGDLQLYTHLVRSQQFLNLGSILHEQDISRADERSQLVDHLEQQYLLKLFPLPNRLHLAPFAQIIERTRDGADGVEYFLSHRGFLRDSVDRPDPLPLEDVIMTIVREGFSVTDRSNVLLYKDFLMGLPVRAIIQILQVYLGSSRAVNKPRILADSLRGTLLGSLYKLQLDVDALSYGDLGKLIDAVFSVVTRDGEFDTGCYLRPQPRDETLKNGFVGLAAEVASQCYQRPDKAIRYMLQGPGSVALAHLHMPSGSANDVESFFSTFRKEFSIGRQEDALNWARYAATVLLHPAEKEGIGPGVVKLIGRHASREDAYRENRALALHPAQEIARLVARHHVMLGATRTYMSVFNLLGAIERLLKLGELPDDELHHEVGALLRRLVSTVTISAPSWLSKRGVSDPSENDGQESAMDSLVEAAIERELDGYVHWIRESRHLARNLAPSALMLGKIWARLYFSLARAQGPYKTHEFGVGTIMHLNTMCLINAFLVEEFDFGKNGLGGTSEIILSRANPSTNGSAVIHKLIQLSNRTHLEITLPFTSLLMKCPLLHAFIPAPKEAVANERDYFRQRTNASRLFFNGDETRYSQLAEGLETVNDWEISMNSRRPSPQS